MSIKKVVPGSLTDAYKKREGDFAPDLVGFQFTSNGGTPYFTFGNFAITSNFEGRIAKDFKLGDWSQEYCLIDLNLTPEQSKELSNREIFVNLNYDKSDLSRYVYFGSFVKFLESEITDILNTWPASLYVVDLPPYQSPRSFPVNTVLSYNYNSDTNKSSFLIPTVAIENKFGLNYTNDPESTGNDLNDIPTAFLNYVIFTNETEYPILEFTGSTDSYQYLTVVVEGETFPELSGTTFGRPEFHFKPKHQIVENFFNSLSEFGEVLLDRLISPKYTMRLRKPFKTDAGTIVYTTTSDTWPVSDGYNLDTDTDIYNNYLESIFWHATDFDEIKTDLVSRRFVSESIHEWDTDGGGDELTGRKVNKLLRIYGREFDEVKKYIDGISFANVVSYNKQDNTSDSLIKMMARTLGFDVLLSLGTNDFDVLAQITPGAQPQFQGYSRELSPREMDIELWRRLIVNAWWLYKSKGTRKVLEFFLKLFGINECLLDLNEHVYIAKDKINVGDTLIKLSGILGNDAFFDTDSFQFDDYGFPRTLPDTTGYYFQNDGFWYNGGTERTTGNNPHYGPYDFGQRYFDKFRCFIDNFSATTIQERVQINETNFFLDYNEGTFNPFESGVAISPYGDNLPDFLLEPDDNAQIISAGLVVSGTNDGPPTGPTTGNTYSMRITFSAGESEQCDPCQYNLVWGDDGIVYYQTTDINNTIVTTPLVDESCCDGYWLPFTSEKCPSINELQVTTGGVIISNGQPISQECCTPKVTGTDTAIWDGSRCIIPGIGNDGVGDLKNCTNIQMAITPNGVVIDSATGQSIPMDCCTKAIVGNEVMWDGKACVLNEGDGPITPVLEETSKTRGQEYDIFSSKLPPEQPTPTEDGTLPEESTDPLDTYYCWWCPPNSELITVCSPEEFIENLNLTEEEFIISAQSYGFKGTTYDQAVTFMTGIMSQFFKKGRCILMVASTGEILTNSQCCTVRGGTWDSKNKICIVTQQVDCDPMNILEAYNNTSIVVDTSGKQTTVLNQSCCESLGYYWTNTTITVTEGDVITTLDDLHTQQVLNSLNYTNDLFCSVCPTNIFVTADLTVTDVDGNSLNQKCCENYGYNFVDGVCKKCNPSQITVAGGEEILNSDGSIVSETCCDIYGGYWELGLMAGQDRFGCWTCPQTYTLTDEVVNGINYTIIRDTSGNDLSQSCCNYYNNKTGDNTGWDTNIGCYRLVDNNGGGNGTGDDGIVSSNCNYGDTLGGIFALIDSFGNTITNSPVTTQNAPCVCGGTDCTGQSPTSTETKEFDLQLISGSAVINIDMYGGDIVSPSCGASSIFAGTGFNVLLFNQSGTLLDSRNYSVGLMDTEQDCIRVNESGRYTIRLEVLPYFDDNNDHRITVTVT